MSWEKMYAKSVPCPCGKGSISQAVYGDDWNRIEFGSVEIECEICAKKYKVDTEYHYSMKPHHGGSTAYYLTPIDYPEYRGQKSDEERAYMKEKRKHQIRIDL